MKTRLLYIETDADFHDISAAMIGPLLNGDVAHRLLAEERGGHLTAAEALNVSQPKKRGRPTGALKAIDLVKEAVRPKADPKAEPVPSPGQVGTECAPSYPARILEALKKRPMTSLELSQHLQLEPKQVYAPCKVLKDDGSIVSERDETDGQTRWKLAE